VHVPKEMYSIGGVLDKFPVSGLRMPGIRTKVARNVAASLLRMCGSPMTACGLESSPNDDATKDTDVQSNKASMTTYVKDLLDIVEKEKLVAPKKDCLVSSLRGTGMGSMISKAAVKAIKGSIKHLLKHGCIKWVRMEKILQQNHVLACHCFQKEEQMGSWLLSMSAQKKVLLTLSANQQTLVTPPLDLPADNEEEEDEGGIDIVLTQIQEEMMLQNLLHKRMLRHDRALTFEHKSRHKL